MKTTTLQHLESAINEAISSGYTRNWMRVYISNKFHHELQEMSGAIGPAQLEIKKLLDIECIIDPKDSGSGFTLVQRNPDTLEFTNWIMVYSNNLGNKKHYQGLPIK